MGEQQENKGGSGYVRGSGKTGRTSNALTTAQAYKLTSWLDSQRELLTKNHVTRAKAAEMAAEKLGFPVTEYNIYHSCKVLELKLRGTDRQKVGSRTQRIRQLTEQVAALQALVTASAAELVRAAKDTQTVLGMVAGMEKAVELSGAEVVNISSRLATVERKNGIEPGTVFRANVERPRM